MKTGLETCSTRTYIYEYSHLWPTLLTSWQLEHEDHSNSGKKTVKKNRTKTIKKKKSITPCTPIQINFFRIGISVLFIRIFVFSTCFNHSSDLIRGDMTILLQYAFNNRVRE